METQKEKDEVLRKIGRNIMIFQQMEHMLKYLIANGDISGFASELKENHQRRVNKIGAQTMGQLVGQYLETSFSDSEKVSNEQKELKEPWFFFKYRVECSSEYYEERKKTLATIVKERNDLIHHLLPNWDMRSLSSTTKIAVYLDKQREEILPEFDLLKNQITSFQEMREKIVVYLDSEQGKKDLVTLPRLRQSQLTAWLFDIAEKHSRPDGWMVLSAAAHFIKQNIPQEITGLEKKYGYKKLKAFMLATEYFDITEEPTDRGGLRVLYRVKPSLKFID